MASHAATIEGLHQAAEEAAAARDHDARVAARELEDTKLRVETERIRANMLSTGALARLCVCACGSEGWPSSVLSFATFL